MLLTCMVVFAGIAQVIVEAIIDKTAEGEEVSKLVTLWIGVGSQLGFLVGYFAFRQMFSSVTIDDSSTHKGTAILVGLKWLLFTYPAMIAIGLGWEALLLLLGYEQIDQEPVKMLLEGGTPFEKIFLYATIVLIAPICEEVVFRGSIFRFLHRQIPLYGALGISAGLFALMHVNLFSFMPLVVVGAGLALAYRESGSILSSMTFHATFNSIQLLLILNFSEYP